MHFLSREVWVHDDVRDRTAGELAEDDAVLIVNETGDEKFSTDVHLTYTSARGHALIDRGPVPGRRLGR